MSRFFFLSNTDLGRRVLRQAFSSATRELDFGAVLSLCQLYNANPWEAAAMVRPRIFNGSRLQTLNDKTFRMLPQDSIESVKLADCGFDTLLATLSILTSTRNLTSLSLSNNPLTSKSVKGLSEMIPQCEKLVSLSLAGCDLRIVNPRVLETLATSQQLRVFDLDGAIITDDQAALLQDTRETTTVKKGEDFIVAHSLPPHLYAQEPQASGSSRVQEHQDLHSHAETSSAAFSLRR